MARSMHTLLPDACRAATSTDKCVSVSRGGCSPTSAILAVKSRAIRMFALFRSLCATCRPSKAAQGCRGVFVGAGGSQSHSAMGATTRRGFMSEHKRWTEPPGLTENLCHAEHVAATGLQVHSDCTGQYAAWAHTRLYLAGVQEHQAFGHVQGDALCQAHPRHRLAVAQSPA